MSNFHPSRRILAARTIATLLLAWAAAGLLAGSLWAEEKPAAPPATAPPAPSEPLPPGVIARVNGKDLTLQDYLGYLYASFGKSRLEELIDRLLVEEEAKNLGIALVYNLIAVPLAFFGYVTPLVAALAMSGSSTIVTLNALRARGRAPELRAEAIASHPVPAAQGA